MMRCPTAARDPCPTIDPIEALRARSTNHKFGSTRWVLQFEFGLSLGSIAPPFEPPSRREERPCETMVDCTELGCNTASTLHKGHATLDSRPLPP
mmetsp:Transcript_118388/g.297748  ORF Transcript_118388/g.297748 Transcript_118388/m.297748 type:complete len:95 (-) Transcript_118388:85-369(-)